MILRVSNELVFGVIGFECGHGRVVILEIQRIDCEVFRGLINCTFIEIKLVRYVCHNRVEELRTLISLLSCV